MFSTNLPNLLIIKKNKFFPNPFLSCHPFFRPEPLITVFFPGKEIFLEVKFPIMGPNKEEKLTLGNLLKLFPEIPNCENTDFGIREVKKK